MNDQHSHQEALDLRAYLRPIWRRKWIVLAITVVAAAATYVISSHQQKTYLASTSLYVTDVDPTLDITSPGADDELLAGDPEAIDNVAQLMTAASVTNAVSKTLGMPVSSAGSVSATASSDSFFVTLTAQSHSPVLAARLANTYVSVFLRSRAQAVRAEAQRDVQTVQTQLAALSKSSTNVAERQTLLQQIASYQQAELNPSSGAQQTNTAAVPASPTSPTPKRDAIFGGIVGLVLALIVAFCVDLLDRRLVSVSSLDSVFGRPVLAVLPHVSDPTPLGEGQLAVVPPRFLEELRSLTVMLRLGTDSAPPRLIMVTSTLPQEGKSTVTRDLALVYAESGRRVLVIDGDLRRPSMARMFGIKTARGLVQILTGEASLSEVAIVAVVAPEHAESSANGHGLTGSPGGRVASKATNGGGPPHAGSVDVVAHGTRLHNPLALLSSDRMVALLEEAAKVYDIVLLDTPPVLAVADSVPLMEVVDSVVLVARLGRTTRAAANRFRELIERLSIGTFSGVVANDMRSRFADEGYGSHGGYDYDNESEPSEEKVGTAAS
jgi:Mrp family chromosome partitioning ATPase